MNINELFEDKDLFLKRLIQSPFKDDEVTLKNISQHVTSQTSVFHEFGLVYLEHLVTLASPDRNLINLNCLNIYFVQYLVDKENDLKIVKEAYSMIFSYCLKIYNIGQQLNNIEIYQVLYSLLEQCAPSNVSSWEKKLNELPIRKTRQILQYYDDIINDYMYNPSIYPDKIPILDPTLTHNISARFTLFNILFETEMKPLQFEYQENFRFSNSWVHFLTKMNSTSAIKLFDTRIKSIENKLWALNAENIRVRFHELCIESFTFISQEEFETTFRECLQSLKVAHTRYVVKIVYCLLQLLLYASTAYNEQFQKYILQVGQATWFEIFQCLLDDAVFEASPCAKSISFQRLFKMLACYTQYRQLPSIPYVKLPLSIWDHFYLQRSIFLKSIGELENNIPDLTLIEKVLFTCTSI
ncbi:uncharacterized protein BX663DRAFT_520471 [Cokeromyces recurvatus]|uniref:uncharacterized protein n=1 Tax=Cokeromyces recurvatus TaxID=90255 RepID=UPI00221E9C06|nr:uncharacterized protein BX663DRAFT_520471 [Cokeromyces recurvatus]KAI7899565.1 hypothetical protein BX663DRAFT_520471 [Cokeromyces recurvatus]